jgi:hypothetical protein
VGALALGLVAPIAALASRDEGQDARDGQQRNPNLKLQRRIGQNHSPRLRTTLTSRIMTMRTSTPIPIQPVFSSPVAMIGISATLPFYPASTNPKRSLQRQLLAL